MKFTKATRQKARLRLALTGPSGSGKTWGALLLASGLGGKVAVIDTERESASLYSHLTDFDTLNLGAPFAPERYIEAIKAAEEAGYETLIIDSITHEWSGVGGCLEEVDRIARAKYKGNSWSAWNDVTPRHRALLDAILHSSMHIIVTLRSKTETAQTEENGRKKVVKLGMKAEQRDGFEYEMTVVLDLIHDGNFATSTKDRTGLFSNASPAPITAETGKQLMQWLEAGVDAPKVMRPGRPRNSPPSQPRLGRQRVTNASSTTTLRSRPRVSPQGLSNWRGKHDRPGRHRPRDHRRTRAVRHGAQRPRRREEAPRDPVRAVQLHRPASPAADAAGWRRNPEHG
jgi:hypothetical protein